LVRAAAELVGELGPAKVTLANVGERAGYSRGLATHHFGSKGALMRRLVDVAIAGFRETSLRESPSDSPLDEALRLTRAYFDVLADLPILNRAQLVLWIDTVATGSPDVRAVMIAADREFRGEIEYRLQRAFAAGQAPAPACVHPAGLATVIVAMLRGIALHWLLDDEVDLDAARAEIEQLITDRLQQQPSA
jgi:AcrR family transcriptional regulator